MFSSYFYNGSVKKIVAVFGSLFNSLHVAKKTGGAMTGIARVPLMYGPRQKFLARLADEGQTEIAVRLPRMSFEITSISYDSVGKLNRLNSILTESVDGSSRSRLYQSVPYNIGFSLSIFAKHQDDALQIFEQIAPYFNPEYTVSVKDLEGPNSRTDIPFVLNSVTFQDDYEGDFENSRRMIVYVLDFTCKVKFIGPPSTAASYIKFTETDLYDKIDTTAEPIDAIDVSLTDPDNDTPENFTTITTYGFADDDDDA